LRVNIFNIENGKAKITDAVQNIHYLNSIVKLYGSDIALKIFLVFDKCYDLNPSSNVFANIPEDEKFETVLRSTYPELDDMVELDSDLILNAFELIGELYSTPKYEKYKSLKIAYEKLSKELRFVNVSLDKDTGNSGEITKCMTAMTQIEKEMSTAYKELEDEMNIIHIRGGRVNNDRRGSGKQKDLA
jgi:hypothetical protein